MAFEQVSFADCPYHCHNGKLFNPVTKQTTICPYCSKKRAEVARGKSADEDTGKSLSEILKIPPSLTGTAFDPETFFFKRSNKKLDIASVNNVKNLLVELMNRITLGDTPDVSYLLNFGGLANNTAFVYPYLVRAYKAGLRVAPLVYGLELIKLRQRYEQMSGTDEETAEYGSCYIDYVKADVCITIIDAGATQSDIQAIKGLMQLRANKGKPTIIITEFWMPQKLEYLVTDEHTKYLATLVSVNFKYSPQGDLINNYSEPVNTGNAPVQEPSAPIVTEQEFASFFAPKTNL